MKTLEQLLKERDAIRDDRKRHGSDSPAYRTVVGLIDYQRNKAARRVASKAWKMRNEAKAKEITKRWATKNPDRIKAHKAKWVAANREYFAKRRRAALEDPQKAVQTRMTARVRMWVKRGRKLAGGAPSGVIERVKRVSCQTICGCSEIELAAKVWPSVGFARSPKEFDLTTAEGVASCFHISNLIPIK